MTQGEPGLLRVLTCGSVDDGKSTLIGRLLFEAGAIPEDVLAMLDADSRQHGTVMGGIDYALLADGLEAEREQGITIDVAYRYFATARRNYILADTPGHELFTRNMVTGASNADVAIILVDARHGIQTQTRRHALIVNALAVPHVVLAINKMDLVHWSRERFESIATEFTSVAAEIGLSSVHTIPISALTGDNLLHASAHMVWYQGEALLNYLDTVPVDTRAAHSDMPARLPIQWVCRPDQTFRGYAGTLVSGRLSVGQKVEVLPSGQITRIKTLATPTGDQQTAGAGSALMVTLADHVAMRRGDVLVAGDDAARPEIADLINATLVWMAEAPMLPERAYSLRLGPTERTAQVTRIRHTLDVTTNGKIAARMLALNDIADCELSLDAPLVFEPYDISRPMGGFILIDRETGATVAAGMIRFALRRSANVPWQALSIDQAARSRIKGQRACCIWFTGLSGAGKSTIANALEQRLFALGRHTTVLDGDNVRHGLCRDLGFTAADRVENVRRLGEVSRLMVDAGLITLVAAISPFRAERDMVRQRFADGAFIEVFVDSPLGVCEARDTKGLYAKARAGQIPNFTGLTSPYETPSAPELHLDTANRSPTELVERLIEALTERGIITL
jgi:bifunctional enzyme CysN/CysC